MSVLQKTWNSPAFSPTVHTVISAYINTSIATPSGFITGSETAYFYYCVAPPLRPFFCLLDFLAYHLGSTNLTAPVSGAVLMGCTAPVDHQ
jgi:hypothetical protein